jgi:ribonuclease-3
LPEKATSEERDLKALEAALGHHFVQPSLLLQALTHSSLRHEKYEKSTRPAKDGSPRTAADADLADNERLEFLGDAIVGLLVAESLYRRFPGLSEGELTRLRAALVSRKHLGEVGEKLGLGRWLRMGRNAERSGGRTKGVLLANCVEALAAALYLDAPELDAPKPGTPPGEGSASCGSGGLSAAAAFVESAIIGIAATRLHRELQANEAIGDYKSALQELLQARGERQPDYVLKAATGPDHQKRFVV